MFEMDGKIALVTGASRGIGEACAVALDAAGDVLVGVVHVHVAVSIVGASVPDVEGVALVVAAADGLEYRSCRTNTCKLTDLEMTNKNMSYFEYIFCAQRVSRLVVKDRNKREVIVFKENQDELGYKKCNYT